MSEAMTYGEFEKMSGEGFYNPWQSAAETRCRIAVALKDRERMILSARTIDAMVDDLHEKVNKDFPITDEVTP